MAGLLLPAALLLASPPLSGGAHAQGFFVPNQPRPAPPQQQQQQRGQQPGRQAPPAQGAVPTPNVAEEPPPPPLPMPPIPELPALPKGAPPPAAVFGVIGVPEVMRASTAAQQVDREIGVRRQKLNEDYQKEQAAWRDLQQTLANQRSTMSPDQARAKERELADRINSAQRAFQKRDRVTQQAAQVALNQIQAALIAIIRQVSESHGMNVVLQRQQVALNMNEFDITDQVIAQVNKLLPKVDILPDGVEPKPNEVAPVPLVGIPAPAAATAAPTTPPAAPKP
jgi:Skp family chaperone for outer membrane proteins